MRCVKCGAKEFKEARVSLAEGVTATAWKCKKCGETLLEPEAAQKALLLNKLRHGVKVTIGQLGKSLVMRFPVEVVQIAGLKKGAKVVIHSESSDRLVVTPA